MVGGWIGGGFCTRATLHKGFLERLASCIEGMGKDAREERGVRIRDGSGVRGGVRGGLRGRGRDQGRGQRRGQGRGRR